MMGRTHRLPEMADKLFNEGALSCEGGPWLSAQGFKVQMFGRDEALALNEDLEMWRAMPGWFAVGQDADDALLCVDGRTGRCALVEVDDLRAEAAQELAPSLGELLAQGSWEGGRA